VLWRHDLGGEVRALSLCRAASGLTVAAGCADGSIHVFNASDGKPLSQYRAGGPVLELATASLGTAQGIVAGTADGNLQVLGAAQRP